MRIVAIGDTHGMHKKLIVPDGDILIHSGDCLNAGTGGEFMEFTKWFSSLPHKYKILVPGNHDKILQADPELAVDLIAQAGGTYLVDESTYIEGLKIYGSPWTPTFYDWAFMKERGEDIRERWEAVPKGTDILITHGPPRGRLDTARGLKLGCVDLLQRVTEVRPKLHIFGHIHEQGGRQREVKGTRFVNCSVLDGRYKMVHKIQEIDICT